MLIFTITVEHDENAKTFTITTPPVEDLMTAIGAATATLRSDDTRGPYFWFHRTGDPKFTLLEAVPVARLGIAETVGSEQEG